jgi:hypothetical protein
MVYTVIFVLQDDLLLARRYIYQIGEGEAASASHSLVPTTDHLCTQTCWLDSTE